MEKRYDCVKFSTHDKFGNVFNEYLMAPDKKILFSVCDLCDTPEDAVIGRDLFDCEDFMDALNLGICLGQQGYTCARIIDEE